MTKRQWICLIVAMLVFCVTGVAGVLMSTWSKTALNRAVASGDEIEDEIVSYITGTDSEMTESLIPGKSYAAVVPVEGTITKESTVTAYTTADVYDHQWILGYIDELIDNEDNVAIILDINSGGGEMSASDELYLKLMEYKELTGRPVYAYFGDYACSGAYYVAMAADEIWANRNSICVNIGVYIATYNFSGLFEKYGVEQIMIKSSDNKGIGAIGEPWTEEQLDIYQSIVDLYYDQFLEVVAQGRGMTKNQVKTLDDGREMLASQALEAGFVDSVCLTYDEFESHVLEELGGDVSVYETAPYKDNPFEYLFDYFYGKISALVPRSDGELLSDFVTSRDGITVMAYAG